VAASAAVAPADAVVVLPIFAGYFTLPVEQQPDSFSCGDFTLAFLSRFLQWVNTCPAPQVCLAVAVHAWRVDEPVVCRQSWAHSHPHLRVFPVLAGDLCGLRHKPSPIGHRYYSGRRASDSQGHWGCPLRLPRCDPSAAHGRLLLRLGVRACVQHHFTRALCRASWGRVGAGGTPAAHASSRTFQLE
jgi:hypothetical protein